MNMMAILERCVRLACVAATVATITGCRDGADRPVPVSGRVFIDGKPLPDATVQVVPRDSRPAVSQTDDEGRFSLTTFRAGDGCVRGTHRVVVVAVAYPTPTTEVQYVPDKYMGLATTDLEVTIEQATDDLELHLTWGNQKGPITRSVVE